MRSRIFPRILSCSRTYCKPVPVGEFDSSQLQPVLFALLFIRAAERDSVFYLSECHLQLYHGNNPTNAPYKGMSLLSPRIADGTVTQNCRAVIFQLLKIVKQENIQLC